MKTLTILAMASAIIAAACYAEWDVHGSKRILALAKLTTFAGHTFTQDEKDALEAAYPSIVKMADSDDVVRNFWEIIRDEPAKDIPWDEAVQLIQKGKIRHIFQAHSLDVQMVAANGKRYATRETKIDEVIELCRLVDPKRVFINVAQE